MNFQIEIQEVVSKATDSLSCPKCPFKLEKRMRIYFHLGIMSFDKYIEF